MGKRSYTCPTCGRVYFNWCTYCDAQDESERIAKTMEKWGLDTDNLVGELVAMIAGGSFPALNLAFALRGLNPAKKVEFEGKIQEMEKLTDAELEDRIASLLNAAGTDKIGR